jgi:uncharacterized protein (DUF952 family)
MKIYHIVQAANWIPGQSYQAESLTREGFIHFSRLDQVLQVANAFYAGQRGLLLLEVDVSCLTSELRWEAPIHPSAAPAETLSDESLFPHLYGPLNPEAVLTAHPFEPGPDGRFSLPRFLSTTP